MTRRELNYMPTAKQYQSIKTDSALFGMLTVYRFVLCELIWLRIKVAILVLFVFVGEADWVAALYVQILVGLLCMQVQLRLCTGHRLLCMVQRPRCMAPKHRCTTAPGLLTMDHRRLCTMQAAAAVGIHLVVAAFGILTAETLQPGRILVMYILRAFITLFYFNIMNLCANNVTE